LRRHAEADVALLNTTGLRADLAAGPITAERWFEPLPFDAELALVSLPGRELEALFEALGARAAERDSSPVQIAGARARFDARGCAAGEGCGRAWVLEPARSCETPADCGDAAALCATAGSPRPRYCFEPIEPERPYTIATSAYLASGPPGYEVLAQGSRGARGEVRQVVEDFVRGAPPCAASGAAFEACLRGVAAFYAERCAAAASAPALAGCALGRDFGAAASELCRELPCVESERDGRIELPSD
jgi:hypothetical protein